MWWSLPLLVLASLCAWGRWLVSDPRRYVAAVAGLPSHPVTHRVAGAVMARRLRPRGPVRLDARALSWVVARVGRAPTVGRAWWWANRVAHLTVTRRRTRMAMAAMAVAGRLLAVVRPASPGPVPGRRWASTAR